MEDSTWRGEEVGNISKSKFITKITNYDFLKKKTCFKWLIFWKICHLDTPSQIAVAGVLVVDVGVPNPGRRGSSQPSFSQQPEQAQPCSFKVQSYVYMCISNIFFSSLWLSPISLSLFALYFIKLHPLFIFSVFIIDSSVLYQVIFCILSFLLYFVFLFKSQQQQHRGKSNNGKMRQTGILSSLWTMELSPMTTKRTTTGLTARLHFGFQHDVCLCISLGWKNDQRSIEHPPFYICGMFGFSHVLKSDRRFAFSHPTLCGSHLGKVEFGLCQGQSLARWWLHRKQAAWERPRSGTLWPPQTDSVRRQRKRRWGCRPTSHCWSSASCRTTRCWPPPPRLGGRLGQFWGTAVFTSIRIKYVGKTIQSICISYLNFSLHLQVHLQGIIMSPFIIHSSLIRMSHSHLRFLVE